MKNVCVDLDGVLAQYDGWKGVEHIGEPIPGSREFLAALKSLPSRVVIHTTRTNVTVNKGESGIKLLMIVEQWLNDNNMPFDAIADASGKPIASAYVDDRAVVCRPLKDVENQDFDTVLRLCRALVNGHELGSQGSYSQGKIDEDDEGDIKLIIGTQGKTVRIDFGKPVGWIGLPKEQAIAMATTIIKHARTL